VLRAEALGSNEQHLLARLVGVGKTVLDCGCSTGDVARLLTLNGCDVVGIEADPDRAAAAREVCRAVIVGDLEREDTFDAVRRHRSLFDCIVCSHVLEHLRDPQRALRRLAPLLAERGRLIVGPPNVAHWRVRFQLARGDWNYTDYGILDRTHLRFFTSSSAVALLTDAGFRIDAMITPDFAGPTQFHDRMRRGCER
jgi:2-polyprenyl-3-methyl-5-hydroxy-6-metoxy-1,4-benzoquinol methylase